MLSNVSKLQQRVGVSLYIAINEFGKFVTLLASYKAAFECRSSTKISIFNHVQFYLNRLVQKGGHIFFSVPVSSTEYHHSVLNGQCVQMI